MAWSAAQVIGSTGGSFVAGKIGFHQLWWLVVLLCMMATAGFYWLLKKEEDQKNSACFK
jgi:predicted MFS family arabinose efflux permease